MKTKKINAKLILNKEKISELTSTALNSVRGGATVGYGTCYANTSPITQCRCLTTQDCP